MTPRWQGHTDGTPFMQQCLVRAFAWLPLWAFYAAVLLAVPFYLLFVRARVHLMPSIGGEWACIRCAPPSIACAITTVSAKS